MHNNKPWLPTHCQNDCMVKARASASLSFALEHPLRPITKQFQLVKKSWGSIGNRSKDCSLSRDKIFFQSWWPPLPAAHLHRQAQGSPALLFCRPPQAKIKRSNSRRIESGKQSTFERVGSCISDMAIIASPLMLLRHGSTSLASQNNEFAHGGTLALQLLWTMTQGTQSWESKKSRLIFMVKRVVLCSRHTCKLCLCSSNLANCTVTRFWYTPSRLVYSLVTYPKVNHRVLHCMCQTLLHLRRPKLWNNCETRTGK